jgi:hypothetical protein
MKNLLRNPLWKPSLVSFLILGIFILIATGSLQLDLLGLNIKMYKDYLGNGKYKVSEYHQHKDALKTYEGKQDEYGRWQGPVKIEWLGDNSYTEEVRMHDGLREGLSTRTYVDGHKVEEHYLNGRKYELKKIAQGKAGLSAYQLLGERYPWFLFSLNAWGYEDNLVESYMDTLETLINTYEFEMAEFDTYYEDALDILSETPYDSLVTMNSDLSVIQGLDVLKNSELRMAVIDGYRSNVSTYDNVVVTYPGYLTALNDSGVTNEDFEQFCAALEDSMASYGSIEADDPFLSDSVDSWLFTALSGMVSSLINKSTQSIATLKSTIPINRNNLPGIVGKINSLRKTSAMKATPPEVALVVVSIMLPQLLEGDMIRRALREAYILNKGIMAVPDVATEFIENTSATEAILHGYIFEDGGAAITARGIAWATFYNPEISDNISVPGTEANSFTATLTDLIPGLTYYARAYATNSVGTGYGNCISFVAAAPVGIEDQNALSHDFTIHPNPASSFATLNFYIETTEAISLTIINVKGQIVLKEERGILSKGQNQIKLNLSGLPDGIYTCRLTDGKSDATERLVIAH